MQIIPTTDDSARKQSVVLPDGTAFTMIMYYVPLQYGWFFQSIAYGTFVLNSLRICNSPNMLYQFKGQIPFGIACFSKQEREPTQQQDFSSGSSVLYLLTQAEVAQYTEILNGTIST